MGALTFFFDPLARRSARPRRCAEAVARRRRPRGRPRGARRRSGIRTELDYERDRAADASFEDALNARVADAGHRGVGRDRIAELRSLGTSPRDDERSAERTLDKLEDMRLRLEDRFERGAGRDQRRSLHPAPVWLSAAHPLLAARPLGRGAPPGAPLPRRLGDVDGAPHPQRRRTSSAAPAGPDSLRALRGHRRPPLHARSCSPRTTNALPPPWGPRRFARYLRWAWLIEGAAQYFAGQVQLFRPAVVRRMREGKRARRSRPRPATR